MSKKKKNTHKIESTSEELMNELEDVGDEEPVTTNKKKLAQSKEQNSLPDQSQNYQPVKELTPWEGLVRRRAKIYNAIQDTEKDWLDRKTQLAQEVEQHKANLTHQIETWSKREPQLAQEVEQNQAEITHQMKNLGTAWLEKKAALEQEVKEYKTQTYNQIQNDTNVWLKRKAALAQKVKAHEANKNKIEDNIISLTAAEPQLKLQLAGRLVNNIYILLKDNKKLSNEVQQFVNDVAEMRKQNQNKVIFTNDDQLRQFKNKMPKFPVDQSPKTVLTLHLSNALNELIKYDVNQHGSNIQEVDKELKAFTVYANKTKLYDSVPKFSEIDQIEKNRAQIVNNRNQIKPLDETIGATQAKVAKEEQDYNTRKDNLEKSIEQIESKFKKEEQAYNTSKASLEQKITRIQAVAKNEKQAYNTSKARLEEQIKTAPQKAEQEKKPYDTKRAQLEQQAKEIEREITEYRQNEAKSQEFVNVEQPVKQAKDPEVQAKKTKTQKAKESLEKFAHSAKTTASELGTSVKEKLAQAKNKIANSAVARGMYDVKDTILKDDMGQPRNWSQTIKNQAKKAWNRGRGLGK